MNLEKLQSHGIEGFVRFSIKAKDNEHNKSIHNNFKEFSSIVCGGDYTLALDTLLRCYSERENLEALWSKVKELEARLDALESTPVEKEDDDGGAF